MIFALALAAFGAPACSRHAKSPDEAYRGFVQAVRAQDGAALFRSLDQKSRWSWLTAKRCHREAHDIILSSYPEGPGRDRELRRFEAGATAPGAAELFVAQVGAAGLPSLAALVADGAVVAATAEGLADAVLPGGQRVPLRRGDDRSWGYAGFLVESEDRARRAFHDLELVRASAADYERATARTAR